LKGIFSRSIEAISLTVVFLILLLGFMLVTAAEQVQQGLNPLPALGGALLPPLLVGASLAGLHVLLQSRRMQVEQILLPVMGLLIALGLTMIWRLRGPEGVWQQLARGFLPGVIVIAVLVLRPQLIEWIRRQAIPISVVGLILPFLTALFGVVDETGARLALRIGPLPPIQTSELIKVALIIFLAWYIEREGQEAEGRAKAFLGWLRLPAVRYFIPGGLFVALATLALVQMSDFGAVLILGVLFVGMLYAGFETRIFATIAAIGLVLAVLVGLVLAFAWEVPAVIRYRFLAFRNPWSAAPVMENGLPTGITISEGPGYQIQQAVYAVIAGGITGTGLGFGSPGYVPLAHSDFIFAAIVEELGAAVGIAILILFAVLLLRVFRVSVLLPRGQVFERLLLVGIGLHLFTQVFVMVGGTLNLIPLTGVTIPFLSQGGMALLVNMAEIGIVLAIAQRLEGRI
jgi:cell division protein FtsW (lipid II flippase)